MDQKTHKIILLVHIFSVLCLGFYALFKKGLPDIGSSNIFAILPELFPLIISAIFLFLLPLFHPKKKLIYGGVILLSLGLSLLNLGQLFQSAYSRIFYPLFLLAIVNLLFGLFYSIKLSSK